MGPPSCYGSPCCFGSGLQLIFIIGSGVSHLTLDSRLWSGEVAGRSSTVIPWSANRLLIVWAQWAGAKSCRKRKLVSP